MSTSAVMCAREPDLSVLDYCSVLRESGLGATRPLDDPAGVHHDFTTPEYTTRSEISEEKWECVRGIGKSFGNCRPGPRLGSRTSALNRLRSAAANSQPLAERWVRTLRSRVV